MTHPEPISLSTELTPQPPTLAPETRDRLAHLFRATLAHGRIHPLYLPVLRFRQAKEAA